MFRVPLVTSDNTVNTENFWNSVFLYHNSPHLVNRRILAVSQLFFLKIQFKNDVYKIMNILKYSELYSQIYRIESIESQHINTSVITNIFDQYKGQFSYQETNLEEIKNSANEVFISVRILLPRNAKFSKSVEFVILDKDINIASFIAISKSINFCLAPNFSYDIELDKLNLMKICVSSIETAEEKASEWLADILFPKLITWTNNCNISPIQKSLSLISIETYCNLYHELKSKYGDKIVKIWPEKTDPLKFVYEDVAIAAYLLTLWQDYSNFKQKFVDLGCGNGLLVYILNEEGHNGYGIDVRARKIWKMYPDSTILKVETIIPSAKYLYPDVDWIIGNHSDELSPWIPVIAARSSPKCNYFLLPCCSYEFNGKKYQRVNSDLSQYQEYLEYLKEVSKICGFNYKTDRLRIPSTKRICIIGSQRRSIEFNTIDSEITKFINKRCKIINETSNWVSNYEARLVTELVRNCTKLNKDLLDKIVHQVASYLLTEENYINITLGKKWNAGKVVSLSDVIKIINPEDLKQLKNECGGVQTLLKNHHFIFLVKNGTVKLRMPTKKDNKNMKRTRNCWFYENHPNGCPLTNEDCSYIHK